MKLIYRLNRTRFKCIPSSLPLLRSSFKHRLLSNSQMQKDKEIVDDDDDENNDDDIVDSENYRYYENPQEELAEIWEITTDDKIELLSDNVRRWTHSKKVPIVCSIGAFLVGKVGWYQFQFLGMPTEMEFVMVHLPFTFVALHWVSWYFTMNPLYSSIKFKLPKNWKPNEGLLFGTKEHYHQLVDFSKTENLQTIDQITYQINRHKTIAAILCAANITCIIFTCTWNPFGDPYLTDLDPISQIIPYSFYPVFAYLGTAVMYGSPMKSIKGWKADIVEELGIDENDEIHENEDDDSNQDDVK